MPNISIDNIIEQKSLESIQGDRVEIPHDSRMTHLQFRRFAGCPMCNLHIQSYIKRHSDLVKHGIQEVAVFHSSRKAMMKHHAVAPFPLIADPAKTLYREFGVETSLKSVLSVKAMGAAIYGLLNHGVGLPALGESALGLPADFLIDKSGRVLAVKYGVHAYDQWEVDELLVLAKDFS